eukprot:scaffold289061_cov30-Tisochrysis_lutea.AAC.1
MVSRYDISYRDPPLPAPAPRTGCQQGIASRRWSAFSPASIRSRFCASATASSLLSRRAIWELCVAIVFARELATLCQ